MKQTNGDLNKDDLIEKLNNSRSQSIEVIGVGLSRTGTLSLKSALEILNYDKCYHGFICQNENHWEFWYNALRKKKNKEKIHFESLFKNQYKAVVDMPCNVFYEELLEAYPNAKLILTVRNSPEIWYNSIKSTIFLMIHPDYKNWVMKFLTMHFKRFFYAYYTARQVIHDILKSDANDVQIHEKENAIESYNRHNQMIMSKYDKDRLLVFNVEQGWEPLCKFLGCKIPDVEFPVSNQKQENFGHYIFVIKYVNVISCLIIVLLILVIAYSLK